jgi:site-specific DNA-methyltransferase (adenine-specific)
MSNLKMFKYEWIWDKKKPSNFLNANRTPLMKHENILVFYNKHGIYNPQKETGKTRYKGGKKYGNNGAYGNYKEVKEVKYNQYFPKSILEISNANQKGKIHSAQKPIPLMEYLIKTYTNEGDIVLDNCMGSGTTGIACIKTKRDFIGIELNKKYFSIAKKRIEEASKQVSL